MTVTSTGLARAPVPVLQASLAVGAGLLCAALSVLAASRHGLAYATPSSGVAAAAAMALWQCVLSPRDRSRLAVIVSGIGFAAWTAGTDAAAKPWQIPIRGADLLTITDVGVVLLGSGYWLLAAAGIFGKERLPSTRAALGWFALPYLFNLLLALASPALPAALGHDVLHIPAHDRAVAALAGRALLLLIFDEALLLGIGWIMDRRGARAPAVHALLVAAALLTALSPAIADAGSSTGIANWPLLPRLAAIAGTAALAQAPLWAQTYFATGILLDALRGRRPTAASSAANWRTGLQRGAVYGALFMLLIHLVAALTALPDFTAALRMHPLAGATLLGAPLFPLLRTLVESFDGSAPFFRRLGRAYAEPDNYLRGALAGCGLGFALDAALPQLAGGLRFAIGFAIGALAFAGADLLRDAAAVGVRRRRRLQSWRIYLLGAVLGGIVGGALAWYFDARQLQVVIDKFFRYASVNFVATGGTAEDFIVYPLFSKWGAIDLGSVGGGVSLFYSESLAGVINWSLAAPLFGINFVLLTALFERSLAPLRELFSAAGAASLVEQTVRVLRWGPWMAPIISSFLRMAPAPTWYNQDGLIRSAVAVWQNGTLSTAAFRVWSLQCFLGLLAYDWLRILVWFDHMGLRVATLVNLSFVGADALDEKAARFAGHSGRTRIIPEGIRRFLTWAPLLIPFYIPRGADWDHAWNGAEALARNPQLPLLPEVATLAMVYGSAGALAAIAVAAAVWYRRRHQRRVPPRVAAPLPFVIGNGRYTLEMDGEGRGYSHVTSAERPDFEADLSKRPEDPLQQRGKFFYLREIEDGTAQAAPWSLAAAPTYLAGEDCAIEQIDPVTLRLRNTRGGLRVEAQVRIDHEDAVEHWTLRLTNLKPRPRAVELTSYQEPALAPVDSYRRTPAFAAMHVATGFVPPLNAILFRNRLMKDAQGGISGEVGFHAVGFGDGVRLLAYEDSRTQFIGTGTPRRPAAFADTALRPPDDAGTLYSFDPAASLRLRIDLDANATVELRFLDGYARNELQAASLIAAHLDHPLPSAELLRATLARRRVLHDAPAMSVQGAFSEDGRELSAPARVLRPWTHVLANPLGHGAVVGGDGAVFAFDGNAQQNGITPCFVDSIPAQLPAQAVFVCDIDSGEVDTAGFTPRRRRDAEYDCRFGLGYAQWQLRRNGLELEQTLFVPPDVPLQLQLLRIRNRGSTVKRLRVVPYFQLMLAEIPADSLGRIETRSDGGVLLFANPRNDFRKGWAFAACSLDAPLQETVRARFFGGSRDPAHPHFVVYGGADATQADDGRRCAAFCGEVTIAAGREASVCVVLGQAADPEQALTLAQRYRDVATVAQALAATRQWWQQRLSVLRIETDRPEFDRLVNDWLPYQLLTARLWGRTGPQQRSGAFGFRDQLQDVLPLLFTEPQRARSQILLHATQQFREGDVVKWWHPTWEGGTGIAVRTAASDPQLWLPYVVARYVRSTGDEGLLDEAVPFIEGRKLPRGQEGILLVPRVSRDSGRVYEHCRRAIERALRRSGRHGLPLLGSGDWNDGLDLLGLGGRGESVWLGFFLHAVLLDFVPLAQRCEGAAAAARYRDAAQRLRAALAPMWRDDAQGRGYLRATDDGGAELRYAGSLMSAWPALSGAVDAARARAALETGLEHLEKDDRVLLLTPPFDEHSRPYPGRIAEYPPGVRENGGQYSHGASWLVDAWLRCAEAADRDKDAAQAAHCLQRAWALWFKISPLSKSCTPDAAARYGLPPHQQPADVYDGGGHEGRGGWAWYTGAAARMLSTAYDLLGLRMENASLHRDARQGLPLTLKQVRWNGRLVEPGTRTGQ